MHLVEVAPVERGGHYTGPAPEVLPSSGIFPELFLTVLMSSRPKHLYAFGPFILNPAERALLREGRPVRLRPKVFDTLLMLVENGGHLVEKDDLMRAVWPNQQFVEEGNLNKNISMLRDALGESAASPEYVETVPTRGYRFIAGVRALGGDEDDEAAVETHTRASLVLGKETNDETAAKEGGRVEPEAVLVSPADGAAGPVPAAHADKPEEGRAGRKALTPVVRMALASAVIIGALAAAAYLFYPKGGGQAIDSVAVLPFVNESGAPEADYLSDGMSDSIINSLSQLPNLRVVSLNSVLHYKGRQVDAREVGRELNVRAVVMGRLVQRGDGLAVSIELVDVSDNSRLWGAQYDRKLTDILAVQEEIAGRVTEKLRLRPRLTGAGEQHLSKRATQNPEAYRLYLNGVFYRRKAGIENVRKSLDYFNQAVTLDPNFALAWAEVANANRYLAANGLLDPKKASPEAKAAAQKALELDEGLAEAHVALGIIKNDEWDWAGAEREYKRAIELNPNLAEAHFRYRVYLSHTGRHTEALAAIKRAQELDPLRIGLRSQEGATLYCARRYDEAIQQLRNVIKLEPDYSFAHSILGDTYAAKGMYGEAVAAYQKAIGIEGERPGLLFHLGYALAQSGKRSEAQAILDKLKRSKEYVSPVGLATLYVGLGDKEGALAALERAYAAHDLHLQGLQVAPYYDSLRTEPRFQDLMRKVRLPQ